MRFLLFQHRQLSVSLAFSYVQTDLCFWEYGRFLNFVLDASIGSLHWIYFATASQFYFIHNYWSSNGLKLCFVRQAWVHSRFLPHTGSNHLIISAICTQSHFQKILLYSCFFPSTLSADLILAPQTIEEQFGKIIYCEHWIMLKYCSSILPTYICDPAESSPLSDSWNQTERLYLHNSAEKTER